jgi:hypothetical protein
VLPIAPEDDLLAGAAGQSAMTRPRTRTQQTSSGSTIVPVEGAQLIQQSKGHSKVRLPSMSTVPASSTCASSAGDGVSAQGSPPRPSPWRASTQRRTELNRRETQEIASLALHAAGAGATVTASDQKCVADVRDACGVLASLFAIFDRTGRGKIRLSDVRLLQGALGEMGSAEIQSLLTFLVDAAETLNPAQRKRVAAARSGAMYLGVADAKCAASNALGERRSSKAARDEAIGALPRIKLRALTRVHFFVGAAAWVLASNCDDDENEPHAKAGGSGLAAAVAAADAAAAARAGLPLDPRQRALEAELDAAEPGMPRSDLEIAQVARALSATLGAAIACSTLADSVQERLDGRKLITDGPVEAQALLELTKHVLAIPVAARAEDLAAWAQAELKLALRDADASADASPLSLATAGLGGGSGAETARSARSGHGRRSSNASVNLLGAHGSAPPESKYATWGGLTRALRARADALMSASGGPNAVFSRSVAAFDGAKRPLHWRLRAAVARAEHSLLAPRNVGADDALATVDGATSLRPRWIIDHRSPLHLGAQVLFVSAVVIDALFIPVQVCFFAEVQQMAWVETFNLCVDAIYWLHMARCFITTYVNQKSVTVDSLREIRHHYLSTEFWLDALAFWPQNYLARGLGANLFAALALRIFRVLAVRYPSASYRNWEKSRTEIKLSTGVVQQLALLAIAIHFLASALELYSYGIDSAAPIEGSWAEQYVDQLAQHGAPIDALVGHSPESSLLIKYIVSVCGRVPSGLVSARALRARARRLSHRARPFSGVSGSAHALGGDQGWRERAATVVLRNRLSPLAHGALGDRLRVGGRPNLGAHHEAGRRDCDQALAARARARLPRAHQGARRALLRDQRLLQHPPQGHVGLVAAGRVHPLEHPGLAPDRDLAHHVPEECCRVRALPRLLGRICRPAGVAPPAAARRARADALPHDGGLQRALHRGARRDQPHRRRRGRW